MGEVLATLKVMPESPEVDLESLKGAIEGAIPESAKLHEIGEEPVAFGLVALIVKFIVDDGEGGTEPTEEAIRALDNVNSAEIVEIGRLID